MAKDGVSAAAKRFRDLKQRRFRMAAIAHATGVTQATVENFTNKDGLRLCSERPAVKGQWRGYCLIDCYLIGIVARFALLDRYQASYYAERVFNDLLLYDRAHGLEVIRPEKADQWRREFCEDASAAPALFSDRDPSKPWWIIGPLLPMAFDADDVERDEDDSLFADQGDLHQILHSKETRRLHGANIVNATRVLTWIDRRLVEYLAKVESERETAEKAPAE